MFNSMNLIDVPNAGDLKNFIDNEERQAINDLAIPTVADAYLYQNEISGILGVNVVVAGTSSFAARGYSKNRQHIGDIRTANGGSVSIFHSNTWAEYAKR